MKKLLILGGILTMFMMLFACGGKNENVLVVSTSANFPPYEYKEGNKIVGIDADIADQIAKKLGKEIKWMDMEFDSVLASIVSGKSDMALAGLTVTEERKKNVDFSNTYATSVQKVIVKRNGDVNSIEDLSNNKLIGVQSGTTGDIYATDDFGDDSVLRYSKFVDAVQALKVGKLDAVICDEQVAIKLVEEAGGNDLVLLSTPYAEEEYAIAITKGNTELLNSINEIIDDMISDGTLDNIVSKYIN